MIHMTMMTMSLILKQYETPRENQTVSTVGQTLCGLEMDMACMWSF